MRKRNRRIEKAIAERKKHSTQQSSSYWKIAGTVVMAILTFSAIIWLLYSSRNKKIGLMPGSTNLGDCKNFNVHRYNAPPYKSSDDAVFFNTILLGELHGKNEQYVVSCLKKLSGVGDHLLIESPSNGKSVVCDEIHPIYREFNGRLKCYGFDVSMDKERRLYGDCAWRANFIAQKSSFFLDRARNAAEARKSIIAFADFLGENSVDSNQFAQSADPEFTKRNVKYLKKLAKKMRGLSIKEMHQYLLKENNALVIKAKSHEARSRGGPTNDALVQEMGSHQRELKGGNNRVFVVAGANHVDPKKNKALKAKIDAGEQVAILMPKM